MGIIQYFRHERPMIIRRDRNINKIFDEFYNNNSIKYDRVLQNKLYKLLRTNTKFNTRDMSIIGRIHWFILSEIHFRERMNLRQYLKMLK